MTLSYPERLIVEGELTRLSHAFAYCMDHWDYDQLVNLFTPDALLDRVLEVHRGHAEIRAGLEARRRDMLIRHVSTNFHYVHINENEVKGIVYNMSYYGWLSDERLAPVDYAGPGMLLEFHDLYRRTDEGWRIAERIVKPVILGPDAPLRAGTPWPIDHPI